MCVPQQVPFVVVVWRADGDGRELDLLDRVSEGVDGGDDGVVAPVDEGILSRLGSVTCSDWTHTTFAYLDHYDSRDEPCGDCGQPEEPVQEEVAVDQVGEAVERRLPTVALKGGGKKSQIRCNDLLPHELPVCDPEGWALWSPSPQSSPFDPRDETFLRLLLIF